MIHHVRQFLFAVTLTAFILGCQSGNSNTPSSVRGKVTYKGAPVTAGTITFYPKDGGMYPHNINADGTYEMTSLPVGEMIVTIETETANTNTKMPTYGPRGKGGKGGKNPMIGPTPEGAPPPQAQGAYVKIPSKYAEKETSGLTVTLQRGNQEKDFPLAD